MKRRSSICCSLCGAKSECPPSEGTTRYRPPSHTRIDWPRPVPAASSARVPPGSGLPEFKTQKSSDGRCSILCPVAPRSFKSTTWGTFSSLMRDLISTIHGRFVALTVPLITGPAMPNPAATMLSFPRYSAAWRENSLTMRSNWANSLLAKRCLKTGVSVPPLSEKSAKLHFVPPTSPARITCSPYPNLYLWLRQVLQLRVVPLSAVTFEQNIGFSWSPAPRWILWHGRALGSTPDVEDGVHKRPGGLDAVTAIEECGIAAHTVVQECRVGATRPLSKSFTIAEIHGDVSDAHFGSRALCAKRNGNAFVRLDIQNQTVGLNLFLAKNDVRGTAKLNHDLGAALGEALARSKIKRNAGPAPVVDQ